MVGLKWISFRVANVVGPRQTHGVGYDFLRRLKLNQSKLEILGNGQQNKSYIYVTDIVSAVLTAEEKTSNGYEVFNVSTPDQITVNEIASIAEKILGIDSDLIEHSYTGGDRGWKADVPMVKLSAEKISKLGWNPLYNSHEAMTISLESMAENS